MQNNNFLKIEDYISKFKYQYPGYIRSFILQTNERTLFPPKQIKLGMLKWRDTDAYSWAGPFDGNYVLCNIIDYTHVVPNLKSMDEIKESVKTYVKYSTYNWDNDTILRVFKDRKDLDKKYGYFLIKYKYKDNKEGVSGRSTLTHSELNEILTKATPKEIAKYYATCDRIIKEEKWELEEQSVELPVKLKLNGDDDYSYAKLFGTPEEALTELDFLIKEQPSIEHIRNNYIFTN